MSLCGFSGNSDMYGIGIRLGYYLQWYGGIFATLLAREEVPGARLGLALFISATFLAVIIQTVRHNLQVVEIYIILLLCFGAYLSFVPLFIWRVLTGFDPLLDPSRFPLVDPGPTHSDLHSLLLLAVSGFELWFWFVRIPELDDHDCPQCGFLFTRIRLKERAFQVLNIVLLFLLSTFVVSFLTIRLVRALTDPDGYQQNQEEWEQRELSKHSRQWLEQRLRRLQALNFMNSLLTVTAVVVATELTIKWNHITDINSLSSAGQLIPFVISLGFVVRVLYVWYNKTFREPPPGTPSTNPHIFHPTPSHQLPALGVRPPFSSHQLPAFYGGRPTPFHQMPGVFGVGSPGSSYSDDYSTRSSSSERVDRRRRRETGHGR